MHQCAVLLFFVTSFSFAVGMPPDMLPIFCITPDGRYDLERQTGEDCAKIPGIQKTTKAEDRALSVLLAEAEKRRKESWKKLLPGMTKAAVEKTWEEPSKEKTRRVQTRNGVTEEWRFPGYGKLTFQNGVLEAIED